MTDVLVLGSINGHDNIRVYLKVMFLAINQLLKALRNQK